MTTPNEIIEALDKWLVDKSQVTVDQFFKDCPSIDDDRDKDNRAFVAKLLKANQSFWRPERSPGSIKGPKLFLRKPGA